jgi:hypothetical protein
MAKFRSVTMGWLIVQTPWEGRWSATVTVFKMDDYGLSEVNFDILRNI